MYSEINVECLQVHASDCSDVKLDSPPPQVEQLAKQTTATNKNRLKRGPRVKGTTDVDVEQATERTPTASTSRPKQATEEIITPTASTSRPRSA